MDMELRQLRAVLAIAEAGTLTAAATRLGVTQPSVSESLRRAERVAGGALFQRGPAGAVPTALGEVVVAHAMAVLEAMDRFTATAERHHPAQLPAAVRFACSPLAHLPEAPISALAGETWCVGESHDDGLAENLAAAFGPTTALSTPHINRLSLELVRAQHEVVEQTPAHRQWLTRHPEWTTTPADHS
ncbi:LysR family transcriptional regulator [Actinokineospora terrae]|uniref:Regulatory helix-turn-helix protein, lysR family n=1 Tax=Actinokineospora terrae TaxID=155974 RepID=A0A1H9WC31_9PSEU|nr:LysR family transcriptional regulator [Actinokineospora terrae]SES31470.1 regulatory helix-turn-helix protein, lysR family [Actinokineospora terrae]